MENHMARLKATRASDDEQTLKVSKANPFGHLMYYPENRLAHLLLRVCRRDKAFSPEDVDNLKAVGYRIKLVPRAVEETDL